MARRIPRDCPPQEWVANPYVEVRDDFSLVREGFLNTELLIPIARNKRFCHALHGLFVDWKYSRLFSSMEFLASFERPMAEIADAIVFTAPANHWHFCVDGLANLSRAALGLCRTIHVDRALNDDQVALLKVIVEQAAGTTPAIERMTDANYALRNVYVPINKPFATKIGNLRSLLARVDAGAGPPETVDRIYISRRNAATRQLLNEEVVLEMLVSDFGFHAVENESLDLFGQMRAFKGASVVMGPHGAGLTNMVFADKPGILIEMFNSLQQPFYPALAQALGARYMGIPGQAAGPDAAGRDDNAPFTVDVEMVRRGLGEVLNP
jgi:hypothetical protein